MVMPLPLKHRPVPQNLLCHNFFNSRVPRPESSSYAPPGYKVHLQLMLSAHRELAPGPLSQTPHAADAQVPNNTCTHPCTDMKPSLDNWQGPMQG